jgi:ribosomal protein L7/L12
LTKGQAERLPFPLSLYWLRAQQGSRPVDVYKQAEAIVRVLAAPLLADVLGADWPGELDKLLRGEGGGKYPLEKPGFGTRVALLRALVKAHATATSPVLGGIQEWWAGVDGEGGPLNRLVQERNAESHGSAQGTETQWKSERAEALANLAFVLKTAGFLRESQWIHLEGAPEPRRGRMQGRLRRLVGVAPYSALAQEAEWPLSFAPERGFVYLGTADGTRWKLMPSMLLEDGTAGHPEPVVLDTVDRKGKLYFLEPVSGRDDLHRELPGLDWNETKWVAFLDSRKELAAAWQLKLEAPHPAFQVKLESELSEGLTPGAVLEDYRLVQKLGEGGAAVVWEVEDLRDGTPYALKVLKSEVAGSEQDVARFEEEIRQLKRLAKQGCKRVVQPVDSFRAQDGERRRVVMKMPLYRSTLKEHAAGLRASSGDQAPDEALLVSWARMMLEALAELHAQGVVHRDVKPSNFLLDAAGGLVISDFGIAKDDGARAGMTKTGDQLGTQLYMAPEQIRNSKTVTSAADVYALAVSLDELWTGEARGVPGKGMVGPLGELVRAMASQDPDVRPSAAEALAKLGGKELSAEAADVPAPPPPAVIQPAPAAPSANPAALAEWRELYWWLMRGGQLKVLEVKALEKLQRDSGLSDLEVEGVRNAYARDLAAFSTALGEAVEDGILEQYELDGLEEVRAGACISRREAEGVAVTVMGKVNALPGAAPGWMQSAWKVAQTANTPVQPAAQVERGADELVDVQLLERGKKVIDVIHVLKTELKLGLREAKDLAEARPPVMLKQGVSREEGEAFKKTLEKVGATAECVGRRARSGGAAVPPQPQPQHQARGAGQPPQRKCPLCQSQLPLDESRYAGHFQSCRRLRDLPDPVARENLQRSAQAHAAAFARREKGAWNRLQELSRDCSAVEKKESEVPPQVQQSGVSVPPASSKAEDAAESVGRWFGRFFGK